MQLPAYHFEGDIVVKAGQGFCRDYLQFPFEVPEDTGVVHLCFRYAPAKVGSLENLITLGLFDPAGFRGQAHRHPPDPQVIVSPVWATPGFVPGVLPAGNWLAQLSVHAVIENDQPCHFVLDINLEPEEKKLKAPARFAAVPTKISDRPGWYRGELHSHTVHSDGSLTPAELIAQARARQLDFLVVTDHNTTTALGEIDPLSLGSLLLIPGMELTTYYGHALILGTGRWVDWRTGYQGWRMEDAAQAAHALGGLFIMAHPGAVGSPYCTGCQWEYTDFNLDLVDGFEVWNGSWPDATDQNPKGLLGWHGLQRAGRRIPATAGADYHGPSDWGRYSPSVFVYASGLSTRAVLEGIRQGKVILSSGPAINYQVMTEQHSHPKKIGDTAVAPSGRVTISASWDRAPAEATLLIRNSRGVLINRRVSPTGTIQQLVEVEPEDCVWLELYDGDGFLSALANPIFIQPA